MSLTTPPTVRKLQEALQRKAQQAPNFRFYSLYDKMYRQDVLAFAYRKCRSNGGAEGVDGATFAVIEAGGVEAWLDALAKELRDGTYRPSAIRRVHIPKADGSTRPLGIGTIRDRVVQTAAVLVLEPIFEADLPDEQYGFRPGRSAHDALREVHRLANSGRTEIVDADLAGYFDSIPHAELMKSVARRVSDGRVLALVKAWLEAPVEESLRGGGVERTTQSRDDGRGTPQGAPISPLLANVYFRRFVLGWKRRGGDARFDARIVNYADDFVICCRRGAEEALALVEDLMGRLKLTVNAAKTRICRLPAERFDFLGYTIGRCHRPHGGSAYLGSRPSAKRVTRVKRAVSALTAPRWCRLPDGEQVQRLNRLLTGWSRYFSLGAVSAAYRAVDYHARERLRWWLCRKHKVGNTGKLRFPDQHLHEVLGLVRLSAQPRSFANAKR